MTEEKTVVLVVDDEIFNLDLIADYLNESAIDVVCVETGEQAFSKVRPMSKGRFPQFRNFPIEIALS